MSNRLRAEYEQAMAAYLAEQPGTPARLAALDAYTAAWNKYRASFRTRDKNAQFRQAIVRELTRYTEAVQETTDVVRTCLAKTANDPKWGDQLRRDIDQLVKPLEQRRADFVARLDAAAPPHVPSADGIVRNEQATRRDIRNVCDLPRRDDDVKNALRCDPSSPTVPAKILAFVRGADSSYIDRRVYCFLGDDLLSAPGAEDQMALPGSYRARAMPDVGERIGPDGFVVVVKDGRYIGVGIPEDDRRRRQRLRSVTSLVTSVALAAARAVATAFSLAIRLAKNIPALALLPTLMQWRAWLVVTVTGVVGARAAQQLLGVLVNQSTFYVIRALGRTLVYFTDMYVMRALFVLSVASLIKYYRTRTSVSDDERAMIKATIAGLVTCYFFIPRDNAVSTAPVDVPLAEPFNMPSLNEIAIGDNVESQAIVWAPVLDTDDWELPSLEQLAASLKPQYGMCERFWNETVGRPYTGVVDNRETLVDSVMKAVTTPSAFHVAMSGEDFLDYLTVQTIILSLTTLVSAPAAASVSMTTWLASRVAIYPVNRVLSPTLKYLLQALIGGDNALAVAKTLPIPELATKITAKAIPLADKEAAKIAKAWLDKGPKFWGGL